MSPLKHNPLIDEPIHCYFGLSYAQFLVISRTALQSMPLHWQDRFVKCLEELEQEIGEELVPEYPHFYHVTIRNHSTGRFESLKKFDRLGSYDRGRAKVKLKRSTA